MFVYFCCVFACTINILLLSLHRLQKTRGHQ
nr:MAG TPA: hypothetical protein [Caudoviricetes sp.]